MITKLAKYYYFKFCGSEFLDFVDHGLGIEARFARNLKKWLPHLNCSKNFLVKSLAGNSNPAATDKCALVLGAGRLLDFPCEEFSQYFHNIHLVDADPACILNWKRFRKKSKSKVSWEITDISSRLQDWTKELTQYLKNSTRTATSDKDRNLASFLQSLAQKPLKQPWKYPDSQVLVSLNILSQLGIYWRDRVHKLLSRYYPDFSLKDEKNTFWTDCALSTMTARLEMEHIDLLSNSGAECILLLYDDELYYYSKSQSEWQRESGLADKTAPCPGGYILLDSSCWLWHLVTQGSESPDYGEIHRVQARCFVKGSG